MGIKERISVWKERKRFNWQRYHGWSDPRIRWTRKISIIEAKNLAAEGFDVLILPDFKLPGDKEATYFLQIREATGNKPKIELKVRGKEKRIEISPSTPAHKPIRRRAVRITPKTPSLRR